MPVKHGPKGMSGKVAESQLEPILELETYIAGFRLADEHRADALDRIAKRVGRQLDAARAGRCEFDGCENDVTMCEDHLEGEACEAARVLEEQLAAAQVTVDELRRSFTEATLVLQRLKVRQDAIEETDVVPLEMAKGSYYILRSGLSTGRFMAVVLPGDIAGAEAADIVKELVDLQGVVAGMQPS